MNRARAALNCEQNRQQARRIEMTDLEHWLKTLKLRDSIRETLADTIIARGFLKLDDLVVRKSDTELWEALLPLEMNLGEKSRFKTAIKELQLRVPTEVDEWLKSCQLRDSVVEYVVVNEGLMRKVEILFYRSDKEALNELCKASGMNLGEKSRFMQAVERLEEPATPAPSLLNSNSMNVCFRSRMSFVFICKVNTTPDKASPSVSNLAPSFAPVIELPSSDYETVISVIGRDVYRRSALSLHSLAFAHLQRSRRGCDSSHFVDRHCRSDASFRHTRTNLAG